MNLTVMGMAPALLVVALGLTGWSEARGQNEVVTTNLELPAVFAKGHQLRARQDQLMRLVRARKLDEAESNAVVLIRDYEALFDPSLPRYAFQSREDYLQFKGAGSAAFEWVDWGYKECLQVLAFVAADRKQFALALERLKTIQSLAPYSAGTQAEIGFVLNQTGRAADALQAYDKAGELARALSSQRPYLAMALRGRGYALIELGRLKEAAAAYADSLKVEPGNAVALHELAFLRDRGVVP